MRILSNGASTQVRAFPGLVAQLAEVEGFWTHTLVLRAAAALLVCGIAGVAPASADGCSKETEFEPRLCPLVLPGIRSIAVTANGIFLPALANPNTRPALDLTVDCSRFVLTPALVRRYLARARQTTDRNAHFTLDWSACSARGEITFENGQRGTWRIDQGRQATS